MHIFSRLTKDFKASFNFLGVWNYRILTTKLAPYIKGFLRPICIFSYIHSHVHKYGNFVATMSHTWSLFKHYVAIYRILIYYFGHTYALDNVITSMDLDVLLMAFWFCYYIMVSSHVVIFF